LSSKGPVDRLLGAVLTFESKIRETEAYVKEQQTAIVKLADGLSAKMSSSVEPLLQEALKELQEAYDAERRRVEEDMQRRLQETERGLREQVERNRETAVQAVLDTIKKALSG